MIKAVETTSYVENQLILLSGFTPVQEIGRPTHPNIQVLYDIGRLIPLRGNQSRPPDGGARRATYMRSLPDIDRLYVNTAGGHEGENAPTTAGFRLGFPSILPGISVYGRDSMVAGNLRPVAAYDRLCSLWRKYSV